ncbi:hypothetical protein TWF191_008586 [Orbilia oligospora]|uniref:Uncharacterized protein n=1 Tax=Orbilia oligospora TaxID=2813651 RepID=A0A7C8V589_ORBOL|nr:hypothetical protein TWF191_008586 [Orbilia oligospora]
MSMKSISLSTLVLRESLPLGSFVADIENPTDDFYDSSSLTANISRYNTTARSYDNPRGLLNILNSTRGKHKSLLRPPDDIDKLYHRRYRLENPAIVLEHICGDKNTREWLEEALNTEPEIYMIVGLETVGIPLRERTSPEQTQILELAYRVQYYRLDFSWFSIRKLEVAVLQKNQWLPKRTIRIVDEPKDSERAISVTLASALSEEDDSGANIEGYDLRTVSSGDL